MIAALDSPTLDEALNKLAALPAPPTSAEMSAVLDEFPQFKRELVEFATAWIEMDALDAPPSLTQEETERVSDLVMSRVQEMIFDETRSTELLDLGADIRAAGLDPISFERTIGIDNTIFDALLYRLIEPSSIPRRLISAVAYALKRTAESIKSYLSLPPIPQAAYRSPQGKPVVEQRTFAEIVEFSTLPDEEKRRWLGEAD